MLVGMPAAGKSTVGVLLAKRRAMSFVDTDLLVQSKAGRLISEIIADSGTEAFQAMEEEVVLDLRPSATVVATGGSVILSPRAARHLAGLGPVCHLSAPLEEIEARIGDLDARGFVRGPGQSLAEVFALRRPLYEQAADVTIDCAGLTPEAVVKRLEAALAPLEMS